MYMSQQHVHSRRMDLRAHFAPVKSGRMSGIEHFIVFCSGARCCFRQAPSAIIGLNREPAVPFPKFLVVGWSGHATDLQKKRPNDTKLTGTPVREVERLHLRVWLNAWFGGMAKAR